MRFGLTLFARKPGREPVPFKEIMPLKVRNKVSGCGVKSKKACCLHEMTVMFACLKHNDFDQTPCSKEIELFQKCFDKSSKERAFQKEQIRKGVLIPGAKRLSHEQVTTMLKKFPSL